MKQKRDIAEKKLNLTVKKNNKLNQLCNKKKSYINNIMHINYYLRKVNTVTFTFLFSLCIRDNFVFWGILSYSTMPRQKLLYTFYTFIDYHKTHKYVFIYSITLKRKTIWFSWISFGLKNTNIILYYQKRTKDKSLTFRSRKMQASKMSNNQSTSLQIWGGNFCFKWCTLQRGTFIHWHCTKLSLGGKIHY